MNTGQDERAHIACVRGQKFQILWHKLVDLMQKEGRVVGGGLQVLEKVCRQVFRAVLGAVPGLLDEGSLILLGQSLGDHKHAKVVWVQQGEILCDEAGVVLEEEAAGSEQVLSREGVNAPHNSRGISRGPLLLPEAEVDFSEFLALRAARNNLIRDGFWRKKYLAGGYTSEKIHS